MATIATQPRNLTAGSVAGASRGGRAGATRAIALIGPAGTGKTSLAEALLYASGAISRLGSVEAGTSVGDASPEARARRGSTVGLTPSCARTLHSR